MARSVWEVFLAMFGDGPESDEDAEASDDESRFGPSPLDLSVRIGHGGSESERVRALAEIDERAREIESERRDN
ncbi:hypothetical protein [Halobacterium rubrum]|uniref:hypothetical protein n=1 Tax=Halobacterium TaxID=2239 RepID=UPI001F2B2553|nr:MULTISPECIES: hypothetical protein [Halobacterium]MDH5020106.1 hypothetical protein [Halobacterium rubrum]